MGTTAQCGPAISPVSCSICKLIFGILIQQPLPQLGRVTCTATSLALCAADDSKTLITGSADASVKLWDVGSGKDLFTFKFQEPCRAVSFSIGDRMVGTPAELALRCQNAEPCTAWAACVATNGGCEPAQAALCVAGRLQEPCRAVSPPIDVTVVHRGMPEC